jgi:hypothetical protein
VTIRPGLRALRVLALVGPLACAAAALAAPADRQDPPPGGKPVAPIALDYALFGELALGRPTTVVITLVPEQARRNAVVVLSVPEAVVIGDAQARTDLGDLAAGEAVELRVTLTPLALERLSLGVTVAGDMQGVPQARTVAIPLRLAATARKSPVVLKLDADGALLHALPASPAPQGRLR